ncbi:PqqD family protein [Sphingobacterium sp. InxBP1]|uniref:PqqD family protein n=1 Tax=Sphingobacterium sp. InxBP1 TaxID=2870328 RepID=UPI0022445510|nr:PqqD family protein [Sphingobacterium sp. InxBP1]MCW8310914.1 PqqD family protein [Sphingobacterium sp. InxBP1]
MKLRSDLVLRTIGSDHLIVDPSQDMVDLSTVYTLNSSAAWLWEQLKEEEEFDLARVVELLCEQYDVTPEQAQSDAAVLLQDFEKQGLLAE